MPVHSTTPRTVKLRRMLASDPELLACERDGGVSPNVTASLNEKAIRARLTTLALESTIARMRIAAPDSTGASAVIH